MWNAEEYAQKNPLFTDEDGMYRWMCRRDSGM